MQDEETGAITKVASQKTIMWMNPEQDMNRQVADALARWLDELPAK
jgi:hypothetical protein